MTQILEIKPQEIEAESFRIIEKELGPVKFSPEEFAVVRRSIHATGDFSFAETIKFHASAIDAGVAAIKQGKNILVDVNMASAGVSSNLLEPWGGKVICRIGDNETMQIASDRELTRSEAAIARAIDDNIGIVAVGNAPTALLAAMKEKESKSNFDPDLIIGVPVGFVNAVESKEILLEKDYPFITSLGRKGGTPVAVAMINALLRVTMQKHSTCGR